MNDAKPISNQRPAIARLLTAFGWGHRGSHGSRIATVILTILLSLAFLNDLQISLRHGFDNVYQDFRIFHDAAVEFARHPHGPIYDTRPNYLYPPLFLVVFSPLLHLPDNVAMAVFQSLKWLALLLTLRLAWRLPAPPGERLPPVVVLGSLVLVWRYFTNEMLNGNINMFILAGVLASVWLAQRRAFFAAGFLVALLAAIKVTPALILVFFVAKRFWRTIPGALAGLALGLLIWPGLALGWENNWRLLGEWHHHVVGGFLSAGAVYSPAANQGLAAWLNRLFTDAVAIEPDQRITLIHLPAAALTTLRTTLTLCVVAVLVWTWRPRRTHQTPALAAAAELSITLIAMLVLSGYTWKAHYVAMLLPYTVLLAFLADARWSSPKRRRVAGWLIVSVVLMTLSTEFAGPHIADLLMSYGVVLFSALAAAAGLVELLRINCIGPGQPALSGPPEAPTVA